MSSSPSTDEGSPRLTPQSLARTSIPTASTDRRTPTMSPLDCGGGWNNQSTDIRGDLDAGWGDRDASVVDAVGVPASPLTHAHASDVGAANANDDWGWKLRGEAVHPVSPFFPMDPRSTRRIALWREEEEGVRDYSDRIEEISLRISTACQKLSVYSIWNNESSSATLSSMERVEMEISIYLADAPATTPASPQALLIEVQRRKGCSVTFHKYRRCLLDAAEGKFDLASFHKTDGLDKPLGRDRTNQPRATLRRPGLARPSLSPPSNGRPSLAKPSVSPSSRPLLARPTLSSPGNSSMARPSPMGRPSGMARPSTRRPSAIGAQSGGVARPSLRSPLSSADDATTVTAGLKSEGEIPNQGEGDIVDKAIKALNLAATLIKKDRVDAKRLGMESLALLTDPLRAGMETAKIASRVVLLGSANDDTTNEDDVDALFDESAGLGIRETILEMIMTDNSAEQNLASEEDLFGGIEKEFTDCHIYLCLTVLSNALHTIEESVKMAVDQDGNRQDDDRKPPPNNLPSSNEAATKPSVSKRFIDDTNSAFGIDVLSSLIRILGQAKTNPHDAHHSARCLGVLFKGCGNSHRVRARRDLDAKRIIAAALEVGCRSHAKLEDASRLAMMALATDDEESGEGEGAGKMPTGTIIPER